MHCACAFVLCSGQPDLDEEELKHSFAVPPWMIEKMRMRMRHVLSGGPLKEASPGQSQGPGQSSVPVSGRSTPDSRASAGTPLAFHQQLLSAAAAAAAASTPSSGAFGGGASGAMLSAGGGGQSLSSSSLGLALGVGEPQSPERQLSQSSASDESAKSLSFNMSSSIAAGISSFVHQRSLSGSAAAGGVGSAAGETPASAASGTGTLSSSSLAGFSLSQPQPAGHNSNPLSVLSVVPPGASVSAPLGLAALASADYSGASQSQSRPSPTSLVLSWFSLLLAYPYFL